MGNKARVSRLVDESSSHGDKISLKVPVRQVIEPGLLTFTIASEIDNACNLVAEEDQHL